MGEWEFFRIPGSDADDAPSLWSWRCRRADGSVLTTAETFRFFLDCVSHARLHGYSNGPLLTRRDAAPVTPRRGRAGHLPSARSA